jgi:hypothetical protein
MVATTYGVKWREPDGETYLGRLVLRERTLDLEGRRRDGPAVNRQIGYDEILQLRIGSRAADRLDGQPALVLDRANGRYLLTSAAMGVGVVQEVAERLAGFRRVARRRATVVVPLERGALAGVQALVAHGPPFDPARTALTQHELLLTEQEAIFVLEAESEEGLAQLLVQLDILAAAGAWRDLAAGPPRLAALAYAWERPEPRIAPAVGLGF